jgi:hypothetical protein
MTEKADKIKTVSRSKQTSPATHSSFIHTKGEQSFFASPVTSPTLLSNQNFK